MRIPWLKPRVIFLKVYFENVELKKNKKAEHFCSAFVGVAGFEPAASCSQSRRDNRATLHPEDVILL
jgi:hypothetical protein